MDHKQRLALAQQAYAAKRDNRSYIVTWNGGGEPMVFQGTEGFGNCAAYFGILSGSLYNYLCRTGGTAQFKRTNPLTGEPDIATVQRIDPPAKPKRPRGRPRKVTADQYEQATVGAHYEQEGYTKQPEFFPRKLVKR